MMGDTGPRSASRKTLVMPWTATLRQHVFRVAAERCNGWWERMNKTIGRDSPRNFPRGRAGHVAPRRRAAPRVHRSADKASRRTANVGPELGPLTPPTLAPSSCGAPLPKFV